MERFNALVTVAKRNNHYRQYVCQEARVVIATLPVHEDIVENTAADWLHAMHVANSFDVITSDIELEDLSVGVSFTHVPTTMATALHVLRSDANKKHRKEAVQKALKANPAANPTAVLGFVMALQYLLMLHNA